MFFFSICIITMINYLQSNNIWPYLTDTQPLISRNTKRELKKADDNKQWINQVEDKSMKLVDKLLPHIQGNNTQLPRLAFDVDQPINTISLSFIWQHILEVSFNSFMEV